MPFYLKLGQKIREYRVGQNESITDLGSVLKKDRTHISKMENGHERPSKEVLINLISHFTLKRNEAAELWSLAGYQGGLVALEIGKEVKNMEEKGKPNPNNVNRQITVKVPDNVFTVYSDAAYITSNDFGIVFDFAQSVGPTPEQRVVSRIGMSKEHAKALMQVLKSHLDRAEGKNVQIKKGTVN